LDVSDEVVANPFSQNNMRRPQHSAICVVLMTAKVTVTVTEGAGQTQVVTKHFSHMSICVTSRHRPSEGQNQAIHVPLG
jgi:hypothetical protein